MYTLRSEDDRKLVVRAGPLRELFAYFNPTQDTQQGMSCSEYSLPFSYEVIDKLENAVVCGDMPLATENDYVFLEYLLPYDFVKVCMFYTNSYYFMCSVGEYGNIESDETSDVFSHLFLDALPTSYSRYLSAIGMQKIREIEPVEKNLEALQNDMMVALRGHRGGREELHSYLSGRTTLLDVWYGRTTKRKHDLDTFKEVIKEVVIEKISSSETPYSLRLAYFTALCPDIAWTSDAVPKLTLPWEITVDKSDPKLIELQTLLHGILPMRKQLKPVEMGYDPEFDG